MTALSDLIVLVLLLDQSFIVYELATKNTVNVDLDGDKVVDIYVLRKKW